MDKKTIILASSSPRRIKMMRDYGYDPVIIKPECEEYLPDGIGMEDAVMFLSLKKALWVEEQFIRRECEVSGKCEADAHPYIIAADTIVYTDRIIGKPEDPEEAFAILSELRGRMHYVATGVTVLVAGAPVRRTFCDISKVFFKNYSDEELSAYVATDEPYDKAGGYAIQGTFAKYIDHIEGSRNTVIGFPIERIISILE